MSVCVPLVDSANEVPLGCVSPHLHQAAAQTAHICSKWPFKYEHLLTILVKTLQSAGASRPTALHTNT